MADDRDERRPRRDAPKAEEAPVKGKKGKPKKVKKEKKPKKVKAKKVKKVKKGKKAKEEGEGGKKGKKLPVMIALAVVLLGGGFFGMKMATGGEPEVPPITLGDDTHVINLGEFLVNTKDGESFLKANVLIHLADGSHLFGEGGGHGETPGIETMAPYIDAVRNVLAQQSLVTLASDEGERDAKIAIAEAINKVYHSMHHEEAEEGEEGDHGEPPAEEEPHEGEEAEEPAHPDWHSQEGPVLIVYLTDYAWTS